MRVLPFLLPLLTTSVLAQSWTQLPDFPGTARDDAASFTIGTRIYVGTGMEVGWGLTNDWWCFDTSTDTWSPIAPMPATPRQYCAAFTVNDTGYVFGGVDASGALAELWAYHPTSDQWVEKSPLPAQARYACAAVEGWAYGVVATGMLQSDVPTKEAWKYFPATDSWEAMTPVPGPSRHRALALLDNGGFSIMGGADSVGTALSDAWLYPVWFETGDYYPRPDLPAARIGAKAGSGYPMVVAGGASDASTFHDDVWTSNGGAWSALPSFPGGPRRGAVGAGIDGAWSSSFYFGLGLSTTERYKDWWRLDFATAVTEHATPGIQLYPNPAQSTLTIIWPAQGAQAWVRVMDALGRTVMHGPMNPGQPMDVQALPPGRYLVVVSNGNTTLRSNLIKLP